MKTIKVVQPYIYPNQMNFKNKPFEAWLRLGGQCIKGWYPRLLHWLLFRYDIFPTLWQSKKEARLIFIQPVSLYFDASMSVLTHEVIPFIWDCWPKYYDKTEKWLRKHRVKTAIFTARQEMDEIKSRIPELNVLWCPEAVDASLYKEGKLLKNRTIDLLEFGRGINLDDGKLATDLSQINHVKTLVNGKFIYNDEQLHSAMGDAKVTICLPRCITHPQDAEGVETLTQRYWEAMLSRMVIVGHCPKELEELIGYNPVVELSSNDDDNDTAKAYDNEKLILDVIEHIEDYQELVDRNREVALRMGDWKVRMEQVREWLKATGMYQIE